MEVPLLDLKAQYGTIKDGIDRAIHNVVESQHFIMGPEVEGLEKEIAGYLGVKHCIGVSSGTDSLLVSLMAIDIKAGDEVIVPDYSFFATAGVVSRLGATPVFADIDPVTFNIDPEDAERKVTAKTRAIIPVHLYGQGADMGAVVSIARKHGLKVIEDAAQAIGAVYKNGSALGTIGDIGCFSFFPSKNLGCFGDGGCVATNDDALAEKLRILRVQGSKPKYHHKVIGGNFRLDAIQAGILRVKLPHLDSWSAARRRNAEIYTKLFMETGLSQGEGGIKFDAKNKVLLPEAVYKESGHKNYHIYNQYVIRVEKRDGLRDFLKEKRIGNEVYYPVPFHRQECFANLKHRDADFPVSNACSNDSLALPVYPELKLEQIRFVVDSVKTFITGR